ncbi:MAG: hypothetical protein LAT82_04760 [Nanoarchaeota archaeon]|nr:hypothetical protein [Nanoarchaeota archaeon]
MLRIFSSKNWSAGSGKLGQVHNLDEIDLIVIKVLEYLNDVNLNQMIFDVKHVEFSLRNFKSPLNKVKSITYINAIEHGIQEIFYLFLLTKNYPKLFSKKDAFRIYHTLLIRGDGTFYGIINEIIIDNFYQTKIGVGEEVIKYIESLKIQRKDVNDACPFSKTLKNIKNNFFESIWYFLEERFYPYYLSKQFQFRNYCLEEINNGDKDYLVALFNLGLLGAYKRGELS